MNIVFILYHTSWVSNWIEKLYPYKEHYNIHVLHFSNLQNLESPKMDNVQFYDISRFSYSNLKTLIEKIAPQKCVFFTFRSAADYTLYKLCSELNIRKVYLEHGLISQDTLHFRPNLVRKSPVQTFRRQFYHLYKYMGYGLNTKASLTQELKEFYRVYLKSDFSNMHFDEYLLYSQRSVEQFSKVFSNVKDCLVEIGYPIFLSDTAKEHALGEIIEKHDGVIYVHQPLISEGAVNISYEEEKDYIVSIANVLNSKYGDFTLLLHPRSSLNEYRKLYEDTNIHIIQSPNNYKLFSNKKLVLGHYSTALLYGLYFKIPTVVIDYPTLPENNLFVDVLPYIHNMEDLINSEVAFNAKKREYMLGQHNTYEFVAKQLFKD